MLHPGQLSMDPRQFPGWGKAPAASLSTGSGHVPSEVQTCGLPEAALPWALHTAVCTEHLPALQSRSAAPMSSEWVCPAVAIWETSALPSQRAGGSCHCPACYQAPSVQRGWSSCTLLSTVQEQILHLMSNASLNLALKIHVSPARNC